MKVKMFSADSRYELERNINEWLENNSDKHKVIDIKYTCCHLTMVVFYDAMIITE